jgi:thiol:disulfide interchange protein DsbD
LAIPLVFAGGVLTSLTPCIYPMVPITAAIVGSVRPAVATPGTPVARGARRVVIGLTGAYVLGLALVYAVLGLIAGLRGTLFGSISTHPYALIGMANLMLLFAAMMLDLIPVRVPTAWMTRAASLQSGGRFAGAFLMGAASGLVAAPCGAPVMASLLTWVAATRSGALGFVYLFVFSLGMTSLLVVVGLAAGGAVALPRPGAWMLHVKKAFAVIMVIMAQYYLLQAGQVLF